MHVFLDVYVLRLALLQKLPSSLYSTDFFAGLQESMDTNVERGKSTFFFEAFPL
jgi:hypothetical protein